MSDQVDEWIASAQRAVVDRDFPNLHEGGLPSPEITALALTHGLSPEALDQVVTRQKTLEIGRQFLRQEHGSDYESEYLDLDDLDGLPATRWYINGLMPEGYVLLSGRDASFKTFIALDMVLSVATGIPWRGRVTKQARVLYVAGEGAHGLKLRIAAWLSLHPEVDRDDLLKWFVVRKSAPNFYAGGPAVDDLIARSADFGVVVLDTLRRISGGADGNGSDMAVVVDQVAELIRSLDGGAGGLALVLAHTQRTDNDTRGYTGIEDDADAVFHAVRDGNALRVTIEVTKQKDGSEQGEKCTLTLTPSGGSVAVEPNAAAAMFDVIETGAERRERLVMEWVAREAGAGATQADIVRGLAAEASRTSVQRTVNALVSSGRLHNQGQRLHAARTSDERPTSNGEAAQTLAWLEDTAARDAGYERSAGEWGVAGR